jgi:acyl carrier protein
MSAITADQVKAAIAEFLSAQGSGGGVAEMLADDTDLLLTGLIDSLGVLNLVGSLQEKFGIEVDFEDLDPEQMTIVGPLAGFIADRANAR